MARMVLAIVALASALPLGAPAGAFAQECIGCDTEPAVDLEASAQRTTHPFFDGKRWSDGWSSVQFVITPRFPRLTHVPWNIPPTHFYIGFYPDVPFHGFGIRYSPPPWGPKGCDFDWVLGLFDCVLPTYSSVDGPKQTQITGYVDPPATWGWGRFVVTVDPRNHVAEYDEWNNVAWVDVPLWPEQDVYEIAWERDATDLYYRFPER
jgi:hypothetical protein